MKIAIIGNAAGGKTRFSRLLSKSLGTPVTHIDSIQFNQDLSIKPLQTIRDVLLPIESGSSWIIDGFGPLDLIEARFAKADVIILLDWPLLRHYWWLLCRQFLNVFKPRNELPKGANELTISHTWKLIKSIWGYHYKMRPELLRILNRSQFKSKVQIVQNQSQWRRALTNLGTVLVNNHQ